MMFKGKDTLDNEDGLKYNTSIENTFVEEKENEMNTVISQLVEQNIIMGYNQGKTIQRMSQEFGLSAAEVSGVLKDNGLEVRRGPSSHGSKGTINADITAEIIKGYSEGLSVNSLAQKYSISPINITNTLKGNGVTMRPRGRSKGSSSGSRSTMDITTNVVEQAKRLYSMNNSLVETAKQLNINTMKLSQAFKDSGIILRRGRKPKAV
jgi:Mor family transcriptional regulator